jgi:hypothetical protein
MSFATPGAQHAFIGVWTKECEKTDENSLRWTQNTRVFLLTSRELVFDDFRID